MTNIKTKFATVAATAGILATVVTTSAFAADVDVVNNGAGSHNTVVVKNSSSTVVEQSNTTVAGNFVFAGANTGGNNANGNTGGDVSVNTGKAVNNVSVSVTGGNNSATLPENCGCPDEDTVTVKKNGAKSKNKVELKNNDLTYVGQGSFTGALNVVGVESNTGDNDAKWNTGKKGSVSVKTKKAKNNVEIVVKGGSNTLK